MRSDARAEVRSSSTRSWGLASRLDLRVVAEGVERPVEFDYLAARECALVQGFLFGRPAPVEHWLADLSQRRNGDDVALSGVRVGEDGLGGMGPQ